jgi:hypothetical protein
MSESQEYESTACSSTDSDQESRCGSEESFSSLAAALEAMREKLELFGEGVEGLHEGVKHMEEPVTSVALAPFVQPRYLEEAPFRKERFELKEEARQLLGLERSVAKFSTVCASLRAYCFRNQLVNEKGEIEVNSELKTILGCQHEKTTFLGLLLHCDKLMK